MDVFMQGLNVTIYGLGIVFLALLVLMVVIMILGKVFAVTTGKEFLTAGPSEAQEKEQEASVAPVAQSETPAVVLTGAETVEPVTAPLPGKILSIAVKAGDAVRKGDELCVIEAMKMGNSIRAERDGVIREVVVSAGDGVPFGATLLTIAVITAAGAAPRVVAAPAPAPAVPVAAAPAAAPAPVAQAASAASVWNMGVAGRQYRVELSPATGGGWTVVLDGVSFQVKRDQAEPKKVVVNGKAHTVDVKDVTAYSASVVIDGEPQKVGLDRESMPTTAAYTMGAEGKQHKVEVKTAADGTSTVLIDGAIFQVSGDKSDPKKVVVNGKTHTVEIKELAGNSAAVLIDGIPQRVNLVREASAPPAAFAPAPAYAPAPQPAPSPAPAPAPAAAPVRPVAKPSGVGEKVTAPLPGKILSIAVKTGDAVRKGDELCVIEAMKMGNSIRSQRDGIVKDVLVAAGDPIGYGAALVVLE